MGAALVSTPCIKVCVVDPAAKLCVGCGRTLAEIAGWSAMTEPERRAIMTGLADRLAAMRAGKARDPQEAPCG
jgi:predicted Fe-S protein YdhL (DUF1289 family)